MNECNELISNLRTNDAAPPPVRRLACLVQLSLSLCLKSESQIKSLAVGLRLEIRLIVANSKPNLSLL